MRLRNVERGDGLSPRLLFVLMRVLSGFRAPDVIRTLQYRRKFFGAHHSAHTQAVMRGSSEWSVGERELFAAFVSRVNHCVF
jgi:alkylhydroperoxidase family enzyme